MFWNSLLKWRGIVSEEETKGQDWRRVGTYGYDTTTGTTSLHEEVNLGPTDCQKTN